jgi:hypothetical protein
MFTWWQRYCQRTRRQLAVVVARDGDGVVAILYVKFTVRHRHGVLSGTGVRVQLVIELA